MRFFDREQEFEKLREIEELSHEVAQFTIITGRRRIGKTEMVKKFYEGRSMLYFFVARKAEADLCEIFIEEVRSKLGIPIIGNATSFAAIFKLIMEISQDQHINLFIDEFQDFYRVNPSIYSDMQNIWDSYKNTAHINLIVAGSVNTLMNKIFKDNMGTTIHQALLDERVSIAKNLLRTTSISVESIAHEVGFSERAQFCTVFKKHTGRTPGEYRGAKKT